MWAPFPVSALRFFTDRIWFYSICVWCVAARACVKSNRKTVYETSFFSLNFFWFDNFYFIFIRYKYDFFTQIYEASYRLCEYNNKKYSCQRIIWYFSNMYGSLMSIEFSKKKKKIEGRNVVIKTVKKTKQWHQNLKKWMFLFMQAEVCSKKAVRAETFIALSQMRPTSISGMESMIYIFIGSDWNWDKCDFHRNSWIHTLSVNGQRLQCVLREEFHFGNCFIGHSSKIDYEFVNTSQHCW